MLMVIGQPDLNQYAMSVTEVAQNDPPSNITILDKPMGHSNSLEGKGS